MVLYPRLSSSFAREIPLFLANSLIFSSVENIVKSTFLRVSQKIFLKF
nr:MAG TPA: hypothetical protein [Caudoviricetes sp.]